ncbi:MAG: 2-oxo acid dehydrogenase subunit E2 [Bdellovibrionaceae bacterium]|nr:2-oxo acid dehydrogenase subunit E2 [Bdellovibrionales bacterium]MCB9084534.1 2-oxo acid dehydrogenase subunit E2 [Pseudobdellovibrionaceae bacterium]
MGLQNLPLTLSPASSTFRKVAMGTWRTAKDPSVYGLLEVDMTKALSFMRQYSEKHSIKITPAHLVGKAAAYCIGRRPEINAMIRGSRIYLRDNVNLFFQVNIPGSGNDKAKKANLAGCTIPHAEDLPLREIALQLQEKADKVRKGQDREMASNMGLIAKLPWWMVKYYLDLGSWLIYGLNLNLGWLGLPRDPFGSVMITNVGSMGIDKAWAPLCPYTRVPILVTVGSIQERPWVVSGKVEVRPIMPLGVTFDHRLIDGVHASRMAVDMKHCFDNPEELLGE